MYPRGCFWRFPTPFSVSPVALPRFELRFLICALPPRNWPTQNFGRWIDIQSGTGFELFFGAIGWKGRFPKSFSQVFFDSNFSLELSWRFKRTFSVLLYKNWNNYNKYNLFIVLMYEVSKFGKLYTIFE